MTILSSIMSQFDGRPVGKSFRMIHEEEGAVDDWQPKISPAHAENPGGTYLYSPSRNVSSWGQSRGQNRGPAENNGNASAGGYARTENPVSVSNHAYSSSFDIDNGDAGSTAAAPVGNVLTPRPPAAAVSGGGGFDAGGSTPRRQIYTIKKGPAGFGLELSDQAEARPQLLSIQLGRRPLISARPPSTHSCCTADCGLHRHERGSR